MENEKQLENTTDNKNRNSTLAPKEPEQPFHIKYRPKSFDEFLGNEETIKSLKSFLTQKGHPRTYLFTGPSGTGKTTLGRIIVKELGVYQNEIFEINASNNRGIETMREIEKFSSHFPFGNVMLFMFDEVHGLTGDAQRALLKLAEEPPRYVYVVLCTTNPEKLLDKLKNRCQSYALNPLDEDTMNTLILRVLGEEKAELTPEIMQMLIKASEGIPRKALMLLERIIYLAKDEQERELLDASQEVASRDGIRDLCRILVSESLRTDHNNDWEDIKEILKELNSPIEEIRKVIMENMASFLLYATSEAEKEKALRIMDDFSKGSRNFDKPTLVRICFRATHESKDEEEDCFE